MTRFARVTITLVSCVSLSVLTTAAGASAHPRHHLPVHHSSGHPTLRHGVPSHPRDWCC